MDIKPRYTYEQLVEKIVRAKSSSKARSLVTQALVQLTLIRNTMDRARVVRATAIPVSLQR